MNGKDRSEAQKEPEKSNENDEPLPRSSVEEHGRGGESKNETKKEGGR